MFSLRLRAFALNSLQDLKNLTSIQYITIKVSKRGVDSLNH